LHASIETYNISIISDQKPSLKLLTSNPSKPEQVMRHTLCPQCGTVLWGNDDPWGYAVSVVRIGTLDFPGIMEPDAHGFIGNKLGWIDLPKDAKTSRAHVDHNEMWPKSSLKRLEICLDRFEAAKKSIARQGKEIEDQKTIESTSDKGGSPNDGDGEKTPTALENDEDGEDDETFDLRFRETERALQERLAKLSMGNRQASWHKSVPCSFWCF